ncbi:MAG: flagellar basal body rod protein FlgB [Phycisphaerales bacterium]
MIKDLANAGAIPALELTMRFAGARQKVIAHNIANIDTPNFQPKDVSPQHFQEMLGDAIEARRAENGGASGDLDWRETRQIRHTDDGGLTLDPLTDSPNVLFHDRNDRDLERLMQSMVENAGMYRVASDLLRQRYSMLRAAIAERAL